MPEARWIERVNEYFRPVTAVITGDPVRVSGSWAGKAQRKYASPSQLGTGEGPFVDVVDWRWTGTFESEVPLAGLALQGLAPRLRWVKSSPAAMNPTVTFLASGWADRARSVSVTGSFHGAGLPAVPVELDEEPPAAFALGDRAVALGVPHVLAHADAVSFAALLLPGSALGVGRNRLWRMREDAVECLPGTLRLLLTRGRAGELVLE